MINCFIDPVFFAINDNFNINEYCYEIYSQLDDFVDKIEDLEKKFNTKPIKFNLSPEFIYYSKLYNPFKSKSQKIRFRRFIESFLPQRINKNCKDIDINQKIEKPEIKYENNNVPNQMVKFWNSFLNQCNQCENYICEHSRCEESESVIPRCDDSECEKCKNRNLDLLSQEFRGSKRYLNSKEFFTKVYYDLLNWFDQKVLTEPAPKRNGDCEIKYGKHHKTTQYAQSILNQISRCEFITLIRRIEFKRIKKTCIIGLKSVNYMKKKLIDVYIKKEDGSEHYELMTTGDNDKQTRFAMIALQAYVEEFR